MSQRVRQIVSVLRKRGEPQYRLKQVLDGIYGDRVDRRPASHWYEIESIPQSLQFALSEELGRNVSTLRPIQQIEDKEATKQLFAVAEEGDKERGNRGRNHGKTPGVRAGDDGPRDDGRMVGGTAGGDVDSAGRGPAPTGGPTSSTHENLGRSEDFPGGVPVSDTGTPPGKSSDLPKIEAVSLKFHSHRSLCISSQIGCAFKCAFCATGSIGFKQQLSADQIVDQILFFQRHHRRDFDRKWEERRRKELLEQETTISLVGGGGAGAAGGPPGTGVDAGAPTRSSSGSGILRLTNNLRLSSGGETELPDDELSASFEASAAVALKVRTKDLPKPDSIDSVSIMGMGEALANPKIFDALEVMTDPLLLGFSQRRINVSTVGVIPGIAKLLDKFPQCNLAFSLHSPFPEERDRLVPLNRMYPFQEVRGHDVRVLVGSFHHCVRKKYVSGYVHEFIVLDVFIVAIKRLQQSPTSPRFSNISTSASRKPDVVSGSRICSCPVRTTRWIMPRPSCSSSRSAPSRRDISIT